MPGVAPSVPRGQHRDPGRFTAEPDLRRPDPVTDKPVYFREAVRGIDESGRRAARTALNRLVAKAEEDASLLGDPRWVT